jgi:hypothetical protein
LSPPVQWKRSIPAASSKAIGPFVTFMQELTHSSGTVGPCQMLAPNVVT